MQESKDIQTAFRQALRLERAQAILKEGYTFWPDPETETVDVCKPGRLFAEYHICRGQCDCPDFAQYGDFCKHSIAAELRSRMDPAIPQTVRYS